jgi:hypothetical protein
VNRSGLIAGILVAQLGGAAQADAREFEPCGPLQLRDLAGVAGIEFVHDRGTSGDKHLVETMGGGVAWIDYDGDGWQDLYLVQSGPFPPDRSEAAANRLFRNLGDGSFVDVTARSGTGDRGCGQGAAVGDVDGDGDLDLYVTNFGPDVLLLNDGRGGFEDVTPEWGVALDGWSSSAAFGDGDGDGDLDLYVTRYVEYDPYAEMFCGDARTGERRYCDPSIFVGAGDRYFHNQGGSRFVDASEAAGILPADGRGLGVVFTDFDDDGRPDLYVANDLNINLLFRNRGDGTFEDLSLISGMGVNREGRPEAGMGLAVGDIDGDLRPDLAVTNFDVETNTLYRNLGEMSFEDISTPSGFGLPSFNQLAFGIAMIDLDRDGDLDFYVANGHIFEIPNRENVSYEQRDQILLSDGRGKFSELRCDFLDSRFTAARGLATADLDNDGNLELAIQENGGPFRLIDGDAPEDSWLGLQLRGAGANRDGIGGRVQVKSVARTRVDWVMAGESYQSSSDPRLLFVVPGGDHRTKSVEVQWRSGLRQRFHELPTGRYLVLFESQEP